MSVPCFEGSQSLSGYECLKTPYQYPMSAPCFEGSQSLDGYDSVSIFMRRMANMGLLRTTI